MSRISKNDKYAVLWLNHIGKSVDTIAQELELNIKQVNSILEKYSIDNSNNSIKTTQQPAATNNKNLMITETMNKKQNTVSIMTQQASSVNDEHRKNMDSNKVNKFDKSIFRPKTK